jgi:hypothetical protein
MNHEQRTMTNNNEQRTTTNNDEQRRTTNDERRMMNDARRTTHNEQQMDARTEGRKERMMTTLADDGRDTEWIAMDGRR